MTLVVNASTVRAVAGTQLQDNELKFLRMLEPGFQLLKNDVASPRIQSLIDRGYCCTCKIRSGPLGIYTGEVGVKLTEAGRTVLQLLTP